MGLCRRVVVCGRQIILWYYVEIMIFSLRVLMPLLRSLTWMQIYHRKELLDHRPGIMIVFGYTLAIYSSMENPDQMEWVPTSLFENPSLSLPKESVPDLRDLVVMFEVIF